MRFGLVLGALLLPFSALAGDTSYFGPIVPACTEYAGNIAMCQACNLVQLADNLLKFFVSLAVMASALMFAYAGFLYVTAAANQHNLESAKKIFSNVLIGLIFVLVAFLIIDLILRVFTQSSFNVLTRIQCVRVETNNIQVSFPNTPPNNPVGGTQGGVGAPIAQCAAGQGVTHQNALLRLTGAGFRITSTAGASGVRPDCSGRGCTNLTNMCEGTVGNLERMGAALKTACPNADLTVWGAAETGDAHGENSWHGKGCAVDITNDACVGNWLLANGSAYGVTQVCTTAADSRFRQNCGNYNEGTDHFHLTFCRAD